MRTYKAEDDKVYRRETGTAWAEICSVSEGVADKVAAAAVIAQALEWHLHAQSAAASGARTNDLDNFRGR